LTLTSRQGCTLLFMTTNAISARGLRKRYGATVALDGVDFDVPTGSVFALLGPNGSGKSTTVQVLSTLIRSDEGQVEVAGHDVAASPQQVRAAIGVAGQSCSVDQWLTGRENLRLMSDLHHLDRDDGNRRAHTLLAEFGLDGDADRVVAGYSGGMRRRLDLAMTLLGAPRVLFLDEPTTGLDPRSRRHLWDGVRSLVATGVTVFLTTQYLEEADALADRIALLDHGRLVAQGTAADLKALVPGGHVRVDFDELASLATAAAVLPGASVDEARVSLTVPSDGTVGTLRVLLDAALPDDARIAIVRPDLDDAFLTLTEATR
jgi:ABC-2 type transport system ATP-binding protein